MSLFLETLDPDNQADVNDVSGLHERFLPESPVSLMGPRFLRRFYYTELVRDRAIHCTTCKADGRVVGFLAYTTDPFGFMGRGLRRHALRLGWGLTRDLIARPARIKNIFWVWQLMRARAHEAAEVQNTGVGEALSMAVLPEYQSQTPAGWDTRPAVSMFRAMVRHLRDEGVRRVVFNVQPANIAANLFYSSLGCEMTRLVHAGIPIHRYTYATDRPERATRTIHDDAD